MERFPTRASGQQLAYASFCIAFATLSLAAEDLRIGGPPRAGFGRPAIRVHANPGSALVYSPSQIQHAYGVDQLLAGGNDGRGQKIAIVGAYGNSTIQSSLDTFCAQFALPSTTVQVIGTTAFNSSWALETALDVEWAHAMAPGATLLLSVANSNSDSDLVAAVDAAVAAGANVVSMSWGGSEFLGQTAYDSHFNVAGVTFVAASGDTGEGMGVEWPASSPFVLSVGGTTLTLDANGNRTAPETAWSGSGGGLSTIYSLPAWQNGWFQPDWLGARGVPDVSYNADPNTGVFVYDAANGGWYSVGGTSAGAPQWSALIALVNQLKGASGPMGAANASLYAMAKGATTPPYPINGGYFLDITSGSNGPDPDDSAAFPYDLVTGVGTPLANLLVPALGPSTPDFQISVTPASGTVYAGGSTSFTVSIASIALFSDTLTLSVGGLPARVTATFAPAQVTGGSGVSTLTLSTTGGTTPTGSYPLTLTATGSSLSHTATATLVVAAPDFALSATPASRSVAPGGSTTYAIAIAKLGQFSGTVNLAVSGLPAGATASFSPNSVAGGSGSSVLTITTSTTTPLGTSTLTLTGTSGSLTHSVKATLTVALPPDFSVTASPLSRTITRGTSTTYTVKVTPVNGFTGPVALSVKGLPSGATAYFSPSSITTSGSSTLKVTTSSTTAVGTATLTVTGSSGSLTHAIPLSLIVR